MKKIENFTIYNNRGQSVLSCNLLKWQDSLIPGNDVFGPISHYSWVVDGEKYEMIKKENEIFLDDFPDASGFIGFEKTWHPDNCLLFDAYGKEKRRLTIPWDLVKLKNNESKKPPTTFLGISVPFVNPITGELGRFGVEAWIEHAGTHYFELDYHTGQFLWGREIRD